MDLRQIQYFVTLAQHLNFTHAAEALYMSQPSLSRQIAILETELGVLLFRRNKRKVYLTDAGKELLPVALEMLRSAEKLKILSKNRVQLGSSLRIAFDENNDYIDCEEYVRPTEQFRLDHPEIDIIFRQYTQTECINSIQANEIDVVFSILPKDFVVPEGVGSKVVAKDHFAVIHLPCDEHLSYRGILETNDLLMTTNNAKGNARIMQCLSSLNICPNLFEVDSMAVATMAAIIGSRVIIRPYNYYRNYMSNILEATKLPLEASEITYHLLWNEKECSSITEEFISLFPAL